MMIIIIVMIVVLTVVVYVIVMVMIILLLLMVIKMMIMLINVYRRCYIIVEASIVQYTVINDNMYYSTVKLALLHYN